MIRRLLVPLDGTALAEKALPLATLVADATGADLDLVRVVPADRPGSAESAAWTYIHEVAARTVRAGLAHSFQVMRGEPGECIVRAAAARHVAMVVMTTHARSGLARTVLGSVAQYVLAHAATPTLLVRADARRTARIRTLLVPLDATLAAPLATVIELAHATGASVVLLRVVTPEETYIWQWQHGPVFDEPQAVVLARQQLTDLVSRLAAVGVEAESQVVIGTPARMIASAAENVGADLIVMTSHARTGAQRALQGSVADALVRSASAPVLVRRLIPPPPGPTRPIAVFHSLKHQAPSFRPESIIALHQ